MQKSAIQASINKAADNAGVLGIQYPPNFVGIPVPCAGAVNDMIITKAISSGIDGVMVAGCDDARCLYRQGSALAKTRVSDLRSKLTDMYFNPERVIFANINKDEPEKFVRAVRDYIASLRLSPGISKP